MARALLAVPLAAVLVSCSGSASEDENRRPAPPAGSALIVFVSDRDGDDEIYVMRADGSNVRKQTSNSFPAEREPRDETPTWSPDGRKIAFVSERDHPPSPDDDISREEIYVMNADGSGQVRLTENELVEFAPDWSPDGERLVFIGCDRSFACGVETMKTDGSDRERVTDHSSFVLDPAWSPDGRRIAFVRMEAHSHEQHFELYVMNADGSGQRRLTRNASFDGGPEWSHDGRQILFASNRAPSARCITHDCEGFTSEIYVMRANGTQVRRLTHDPADDRGAAWSADGLRIVFSRVRDLNEDDYELFVMNADGGCETKLTDNRAWDRSPDWLGAAGPLRCVDLAVSASLPGAFVGVGHTVAAVITVRNVGTLPARNVTLRASIPELVDLVDARASQGRCGGPKVVGCSLGTIDPGGMIRARVAVRAVAGGRVVVSASAEAHGHDPDGRNDSAAATTVICTVSGTVRPDILTGTSKRDVICGGPGNDVLRAGRGDDVGYGGDGDDVLLGGPGRDVLRGGPGDDRISGGTGRDRLDGGPGCDTIHSIDGVSDFFRGDEKGGRRLVEADQRDRGSALPC